MINPEVLSFERDAILQKQGFLAPVDPNRDYSSEIQTMAEVELAELEKWGLDTDLRQAASLIVKLRQQFLKNILGSYSFGNTVQELKQQLLDLTNSTDSSRQIKRMAWQTIRRWQRDQVSLMSLSIIEQTLFTGTEPELQKRLKQQSTFFENDIPEKISDPINESNLISTLRAIQLSSLPAISQAA